MYIQLEFWYIKFFLIETSFGHFEVDKGGIFAATLIFEPISTVKYV
jgi:hypothetical protein